jgi:hypothetical protein
VVIGGGLMGDGDEYQEVSNYRMVRNKVGYCVILRDALHGFRGVCRVLILLGGCGKLLVATIFTGYFGT